MTTKSLVRTAGVMGRSETRHGSDLQVLGQRWRNSDHVATEQHPGEVPDIVGKII